MSATYTAVTMDGKEHSGLDLFMIKQWYFSRRLRPDSFVQSTETGEWKLLKALFDPAQWEAEERQVRGLGPNESVFKVATSPQQLRPVVEPPTPYHYDRVNELGLRAAGILLFINAAVTLLVLVLRNSRPTTPNWVALAWGLSILIDIGVGAMLLRSDNAARWKVFSLIRFTLGGLFGVFWLLVGPNETFRLIGLLELLFVASFFLLLIGDASRVRVVGGVTTFVISIGGFLLLIFTLTAPGASVAAKREVLKYALPTRSYSDGESAVKMDLPDGWVMLPVDNPVAPVPEARMVAVHPDTESYAALIIVQNHSLPNLDAILSKVVEGRKKQEASFVEVERVNAPLGRLDGRKVIMTWKYKGQDLKGGITAARNGSYYVILIEWATAEGYPKSRSEFEALENGASAGEPAPDPFAHKE